VAVGIALDPVPVREIAGALVVLAAGAALVVSIARRRAGVAGERVDDARRSARVAAMTGIEREAQARVEDVAEFPPLLDLLAPAFGVIGLVAGALDAADARPVVALLRILVGAAFLGALTDAMLLGHWYLVQPGLARGSLLELVRWTADIWFVEVVALLLPTGMISVFDGSIDDGYNGILGWTWATCAITTIGLCYVTRAALREKQYAAVMAATGLLYLAILTGFGTDLIARAVLAS
ncbi:MAG: hypothetical protein QOD30_2165, partial [Actinomycetota bacterium]|nr:hypothetical protein [Actinomycetota bacterium]